MIHFQNRQNLASNQNLKYPNYQYLVFEYIHQIQNYIFNQSITILLVLRNQMVNTIFGSLAGVIITALFIFLFCYCYKRNIPKSDDSPDQKEKKLYEEDEKKNTKENQIAKNKKQLNEEKFDLLNERKKKEKEKERQINNYIKKVETQYTKPKCLEQIARQGRNKVIFIGNTGAGKSSLINKLYGLNLKTGKLQTTFGYEKVYNINSTTDIYDSQGYNQYNHDQQIKEWENLNYYKKIFILYQDTLKASKTMIECLCKPKDRVYKVYFICTKCDLWDDINNKSIDQEIQQQRKYLRSIGIPNVDTIPFFKSSARKDKFEGGENQNYKIFKLINQADR